MARAMTASMLKKRSWLHWTDGGVDGCKALVSKRWPELSAQLRDDPAHSGTRTSNRPGQSKHIWRFH